MPTHDFNDIGDVLDFELLKGTIMTLDADDDTCTVLVGVQTVNAVLFYHCKPGSIMRDNGAIEGAAGGFGEGDEVIVLKKNDGTEIKVIGHTDGIRRCDEIADIDGNYYVFYLKDGVFCIANIYFANGTMIIVDEKTASEATFNPTTYPIKFHMKRFTHNVTSNGVSESRDLYFVETTLIIPSFTYPGWTTFCAENPEFELTKNYGSTKIPMSSSVLNHLLSVNTSINNDFSRASDGFTDDWNILSGADGGDCEDFALTKAQALLALGYPASALHIECGNLETSGQGHAWLVVQTSSGDYALDVNRNSLVKNSSLTVNGERLISRRRQYGAKWGFMSPFLWLKSATNDVRLYQNVITPLYHQYIFDPLLHIFYLIPDSGYITQTELLKDYTSVNFSATRIYQKRYSSQGWLLASYALIDNTLTRISLSSCAATGYVDTDGSIKYLLSNSSEGAYPNITSTTTFIGDIVSAPGSYQLMPITSINIQYREPNYPFYEIMDYSSNTIPVSHYYHRAVGGGGSGYYDDTSGYNYRNEYFLRIYIGRAAGDCLKNIYIQPDLTAPYTACYLACPDESHMTMPAYYNLDQYWFESWVFIDTDDLLIQSFIYQEPKSNPTLVKRKMYKDKVSITDNIITVLGVSELDLFGLAYIPDMT